ncbi:hypothetical protein [Pseudomonas synxantha]|uniref:hypothetical protein n=1 Tax=Pseudomonas synxantha TaxID=47883 RepID=UPI00345DD804
MKNKGLIISVTGFLEEHSISEIEFKDRIEKLQIPLLCRCPKTVTVHVSGSAIVLNDNEPRTVQSLSKRHKSTPFCADHDYHSKVDLDIKFLSISATDREEIVNYGELSKYNFNSSAFYENGKGLAQASAHELLKTSLKPLPTLIIDAAFFITSKSSPNKLEGITIREADIIMRTEDSKRILDTNTEINKNSKKPEHHSWESNKLFELNRTAEKFIPETNITSEDERKQLIEKIKKHLQEKCKYKGKDLLEQAAFAILPNEHYHTKVSKKILSDEIIRQHPEHASTTLILINEAAKYFWQATQKTNHKIQDKRIEIIRVLQSSEWGFTAKLATAAATIISLKARDQ